MASWGVVKVLEQGLGNTYPGMPWAPRARNELKPSKTISVEAWPKRLSLNYAAAFVCTFVCYGLPSLHETSVCPGRRRPYAHTAHNMSSSAVSMFGCDV
jgi:hypothetical protein